MSNMTDEEIKAWKLAWEKSEKNKRQHTIYTPKLTLQFIDTKWGNTEYFMNLDFNHPIAFFDKKNPMENPKIRYEDDDRITYRVCLSNIQIDNIINKLKEFKKYNE